MGPGANTDGRLLGLPRGDRQGAYRYSGARQAPRILNAIYKGEAGKLLLTAVMFALTFYYVQPLQVTAVFAGYVAMIIVYGYSAAKAIQPKNKPQ